MDHRRDALTERFARFSTNLSASGGIAHRTESDSEALATIMDLLGDRPIGVIWTSSGMVTEQPAIAGALRAAGYDLRIPAGPAEARDQPVGLTIARLGIAETGSVLLHESGIADRSVSLMTNLLIVVCPGEALQESLDDAAKVLRELSATGPSYTTFVSGPSRTADIERQLTIGVQGPAGLHVVFVT